MAMDDYLLQQVYKLEAIVASLCGYLETKNDDTPDYKTSGNIIYYDFGNPKKADLQLNNTAVAKIESQKEDDTDMIRFSDGSMRKRTSGQIEYRFMHLHRRVSVYGYSERECWQKRADFIKNPTAPPTRKPRLMSYGTWLKTWFERYKKGRNAENTEKYMVSYINRITDALGKVALVNLDTDKIQDYINGINDNPNTQKKIFDIIKGSLTKAFNTGKIRLNPALEVELSDVESEHYRALEYTEQCLVLDNAEHYRPLFFFAMCTGIRLTRLVELDVSQIDFDHNIITIFKKQKKGKKKLYQVSFIPSLFDGIDVPESGRLFKDFTTEGIRTFIRRLYPKLGIEGASFHSFRHTFISVCNDCGVPIKQAQLWAGHSTFEMTADIYTHLLKSGNSPVKKYIKNLIKTV